ncbi:MAG: hypothetical protein MI724_03365 [Spirochaetales bacterium]|nr:hypothetical protein [Spirochaetales bacterium]
MEWMLAIGTLSSPDALGRLYETIRSILMDGALEITLETDEIANDPPSGIFVHEIVVSARCHVKGFRLCIRVLGSLDAVHRFAQLCSMMVEEYVVNVWGLDRSTRTVALSRYTGGVLTDSRTVPTILMGGDDPPDGALIRVEAGVLPTLTGDKLIKHLS